MPKALEAVAALKVRWAGIAERVSLDHAAINVQAADLLAVMGCLKNEHGFDMLVDIAGVDWAVGTTPRFTVIYHVFSASAHEYVRLATDCANDSAPGSAEPGRPLAGCQLARARGIRHVWHPFRWASRSSTHPDVGRISPFSASEGFSTCWYRNPASRCRGRCRNEDGCDRSADDGRTFRSLSGEINMTDAEPRAKDESWSERRPKPGT